MKLFKFFTFKVKIVLKVLVYNPPKSIFCDMINLVPICPLTLILPVAYVLLPNNFVVFELQITLSLCSPAMKTSLFMRMHVAPKSSTYTLCPPPLPLTNSPSSPPAVELFFHCLALCWLLVLVNKPGGESPNAFFPFAKC